MPVRELTPGDGADFRRIHVRGIRCDNQRDSALCERHQTHPGGHDRSAGKQQILGRSTFMERRPVLKRPTIATDYIFAVSALALNLEVESILPVD